MKKIKKIIAYTIWVLFLTIASLGYWVSNTTEEFVNGMIPIVIAAILFWAAITIMND